MGNEPLFNCIITLIGSQVATTLDRDLVYEKVQSTPDGEFFEVPTIIQRGPDVPQETITARIAKDAVQAIL